MKFKKIFFLFIALILCFSIVSCNKIPTLSALDWVLESSEEGEVKKSKKDTSGVTYYLDASYGDIEITNDQRRDIDECSDLFGQWMTAVGTFEYSQMLDLFREEMLAVSLYPEFESTGLTPIQAMQKAEDVARDMLPVINTRAKYTFSEIKIGGDDIINEYLEYDKNAFEYCGIDAEKVENAAKIKLSEAKAIYNDTFYLDIIEAYGEEYYFFKYDGRWYCESLMIEDDLCIDLLLSEKDSNDGFYRKGMVAGEVTKIIENYLYIDNEVYFSKDLYGISVGDTVQIEFYKFGAEFKGCADGMDYGLSNALSIVAYDESLDEGVNPE